MWPRTCVPKPTRKRPPLTSASSHAIDAVTIGLREKATATPVSRSMSAAKAAAAQDKYAVRPASVSTRPEKPAAATSRANSCIDRSDDGVAITSNFMFADPSDDANDHVQSAVTSDEQ